MKPTRFPHTLLLIFGMILLAQFAGYFLPAGRFELEPRPDDGEPYVEQEGQGLLRERLSATREARGLGRKELGELFGVSQSTVESWELGPPDPSKAWHSGTSIETGIGALIERWLVDGKAPGEPALNAWKAAQTGRTRVVPGTYHAVEDAEPLPWYAALLSIPKGLEEAQDVIFFVFLIGGVISVIRATGALDALIGETLRRLGGRPVLLVGGMCTLFALGSSTIGMAEEYLPFVPILLSIGLAMRMDAILALGIVYVGYGVGYGCAALNPFTVLIGQNISGIEIYSGQWYRWLLWCICLVVGIHHLMRYARRIQEDPSRSLVCDVDYSGVELPLESRFSWRHGVVIGAFVAGIGLFLWGVGARGWYLTEMGAIFLAIGILSAVVSGLNPNRTAEEFCKGAGEMTTTALLIGFARTIQVVLDDAQITHTVINSISGVLEPFGASVSAVGMLVVQTMVNFFIPSGSGQAYVTMPIMAPLADLTGVSRQTAVLAYQMGDGFTNMIIPTNAVLMGMLFMGRIPYTRWLRFMVPLLVKLYVIAVIGLLAAVAFDYR
jgi:uncharacterized ion transporter superfamily protein YfcC